MQHRGPLAAAVLELDVGVSRTVALLQLEAPALTRARTRRLAL